MLFDDRSAGATDQVAQEDRRDDGVVEGTDDRKELRQQVDRRGEPHRAEREQDLRASRNARVLHEVADSRNRFGISVMSSRAARGFPNANSATTAVTQIAAAIASATARLCRVT